MVSFNPLIPPVYVNNHISVKTAFIFRGLLKSPVFAPFCQYRCDYLLSLIRQLWYLVFNQDFPRAYVRSSEHIL